MKTNKEMKKGLALLLVCAVLMLVSFVVPAKSSIYNGLLSTFTLCLMAAFYFLAIKPLARFIEKMLPGAGQKNNPQRTFDKTLVVFFSDCMKDILYSNTVYEEIKQRKLKLSDEVILSVQRGEETSEALAYSTVCNTASGLLASGRYHSYRGTLRPEGMDIQAVFDRALNFLLKSGAVSEDDAQEARANLAEAIAAVG